MKNYKEFNKEYIGSSDMAQLIFRTSSDVFEVNFGKDSCYFAYLTNEKCEVGNHYTLIKSVDSSWLKIYDDNELSFNKHFGDNKTINIYRAGEEGCIIEVLNK